MAYNKVILVGNLTADPELKQTQSGKAVTTVTVAVQRQGKDAGTDFITVVAWQGTAEFICKYFAKGKPILVDGRLTSRQWDDRDGNKRTSWEVVAEAVSFVGSKEAAAAAPAQAPMAGPYGGNGKAPKFEEMTLDDDLPFNTPPW